MEQEDLFFQECTPGFDIDGCLSGPLASTHRMLDIVIGPRECMGGHAARPKVERWAELENLGLGGARASSGYPKPF